ncbi:MAG TPA: DNA recombination protein RmuC, partial [Gammaproteobacteria bacterium]|nr:DNA recombination protein RmuC [Gammaproteobacteria bacterium]
QQQSLNLMLTPFREQLGDFRKRVEEVYRNDTKERSSLLNEVQNLQKASARINEETENLTKALKGDNKIQGNWGELVLERILEDSGLRKDHEYFIQPTRLNEEGAQKRPDVVIRLPDGKDVVIDSKVTLTAYENAVATEDDGERNRHLQSHLQAVKGQIKKLASQDYDQLPGFRSLDFVLLFIPIETAFTLAMEMEPRLFTDAFNKRIMIVSPTTLMMALRIIDNLWQVEKQ